MQAVRPGASAPSRARPKKASVCSRALAGFTGNTGLKGGCVSERDSDRAAVARTDRLAEIRIRSNEGNPFRLAPASAFPSHLAPDSRMHCVCVCASRAFLFVAPCGPPYGAHTTIYRHLYLISLSGTNSLWSLTSHGCAKPPGASPSRFASSSRVESSQVESNRLAPAPAARPPLYGLLRCL